MTTSKATSREYYVGNQVYKTIPVEVMGMTHSLKVSDIGCGIIGVVYVYNNEENAKKDNGDGYTKSIEIVEYPNLLQKKGQKWKNIW